MWLRRARRVSEDTTEPDGGPLADECEAFLAGQLLAHLRLQGRAVPAWVMLNGVAHASAQEVQDIATDESRSPVEREIAAAALAATGSSPEELERVQRAHLVPLELSLIGRVVTSRGLLELASHALFMTS